MTFLFIAAQMTTPVSLGDQASLVTAIFTAVIALFTAFAAWQARATVRDMRQAMREGYRKEQKVATIDNLNKVRDAYHGLQKQLEGQKGKPVNEDEERVLINLFSIWEHLSAGLNAGVLDLSIFYDMVGPRLLGLYKQNAAFIRRRHRSNPGFMINLRSLLIDYTTWSGQSTLLRNTCFVDSRRTISMQKSETALANSRDYLSVITICQSSLLKTIFSRQKA